jgi:sec-independent protein translocase protein TatA
MGSIGMTELLLILLIVLLIFGGRKIPELARGLGEGIRNFRESMRGDQDEKKNRPS